MPTPTGPFAHRLAGSDTVEELRSASGELVGRIRRQCEPVDAVAARARRTGPTRWACSSRSSSTVENVTDWSDLDAPRDVAMRHSLVAVHTLLAVDDGRFVSLLDPPDDARGAVSGCTSEGTFPVLVGDGDTVVLSSPIILYDHPEVAPESDGPLYDATEIDEILALRVLTLTDEEKAEARATDPRAAAIVDRIDDMEPDVWARLHGTMREFHAPRSACEPIDEEPPLPWWEPAVDAAVDPWTDTVVVAGSRCAPGRACASTRRVAPMRTTCSSTAWSPRSPVCSTTSTARCTSR